MSRSIAEALQNQRSFSLKTSLDLDPLMERIGNARIVLLGEATHGTHEYYTWRTAITKRLIREKGFNIIGVEGDWPDCYRVNRFIKGLEQTDKTALQVLRTFQRWPTWMWANWEMVALTEWLSAYNKKANKKTSFYGLDVYSLCQSIEVVVDYLQKNDPNVAHFASDAMQCFEPYKEEGKDYAMAVYNLSADCRDEVVQLLAEVQKRLPSYDGDKEASLNAKINALVAVEAERYYRSMLSFNSGSWNIRDNHMANTLNEILNFHEGQSKAVVWEHNTHVGDARATDMSRDGLTNVGQIVRENYDEDEVVIVGFGCYKGEVIAARSWGGDMKRMHVPEAKPGSVEELLHRESTENRLLIFNDPATREHFNYRTGHRAIGVVYHPDNERGNYVPTKLADRYDAFIFFDRTTAVHPLHMEPYGRETPDTFPFGF